MDEKQITFPPGTLPGKSGYFYKNAQNQPQQQHTDCFIILQKLCKILEKKFLVNGDHF